MIVEVKDPLKQGLKHIWLEVNLYVSCIVEVKDPLKQGLKLFITPDGSESVECVEVKDPLKQGLKQPLLDWVYNLSNQGWSERSIKTRIETFLLLFISCRFLKVEVKDPLKQGLKLKQ